MSEREGIREGSLDAPTRHPVPWKSEAFWDKQALGDELERVYDICHGCRRCVSLCNAFPTLFDLVDESDTMEVDGVDRADYDKVVDQCYLCDLCYMTKCPYVPPHEWNVDFPHPMLRAKAVNFKDGKTKLRDKVLTSTDAVGNLAGIPVVAQVANAVNASGPGRAALEATLGVHRDAPVPKYYSKTFRKAFDNPSGGQTPTPTATTTGKIALFATCYGNRNKPDMVHDLAAILAHNGIVLELTGSERCCGMPKLELGDLETVERLMEHNVPELLKLVEQGYDLTAPIPSCVLMFKQELPLLFPDNEAVQKVGAAFFDPFEYLALRHKEGLLNTDFSAPLGKVAYHVPCHQRVQNIGLKTREILELVPDTEVMPIERCSGHDGTYGIKKDNYEFAKKICRPVVRKVVEGEVDHYISDCPMAGEQIGNGMETYRDPETAFGLLRKAYGL